jgi:hypothetical protein
LSAGRQQLSPSLAWHRLFSQQRRLTFCANRPDIDVGLCNVRFGSKADICSANGMSALPPKADIGQRFVRQSWRCKFDPWMRGSRETSNKITQKGLAFSRTQSGTVSSSEAWLRFGFLPRRLVR